jgi:two-component system, cell cycle sensor histidine kinase and response regulator CckA
MNSENKKRIKSGKERSKILIVDDEVIILKSAKRILEKKGYSVLTAENGHSAMEILRENYTEIGAILLDLSMPGMAALEAMENILSIDAEAKVIVFSGYSRTQEFDALFEKGAVGHIQKPFDIKSLTAMIDRWIK